MDTWYLISFRAYGRFILKKYCVFIWIVCILIVFNGKAWLCLPPRSPDINTRFWFAPSSLPVHLLFTTSKICVAVAKCERALSYDGYMPGLFLQNTNTIFCEVSQILGILKKILVVSSVVYRDRWEWPGFFFLLVSKDEKIVVDLFSPCRNINGFGQMRFIKRFWYGPFNIGVYGKYHLFYFTQETYLSKDLGEIYMKKICKGMEIRTTLRHLGVQ